MNLLARRIQALITKNDLSAKDFAKPISSNTKKTAPNVFLRVFTLEPRARLSALRPGLVFIYFDRGPLSLI